ncbi:ABC transporter substrate-binding protein [Brachyspira hyodysenteriae]|uniref:Periplasmic-iron-binding protein BitB n=1 Tax=Brachyspira hyodysenteriae (strain ATCC 49526 / WA1) TaxID=565034 RepID=A0A3B6VIA9_BRAHW|nr:ABC transporter substrate-binding protein [Brachyspira hyodysenteriae]ACN85024.1 periplasmic-iron-binding protein BitB [Brachyspira hyodysenteriae WA1]KLI44394.1 ABC transporter substrate-binding protein [Brachyspira hyodysenteriae]KLI52758.1 ABC transporter substrate-binding protein [Brachyspira hyodysenteriae]KLI57829.1 ABC transporter substrate-binding protein [Brachyspira hyodysenteriae]KLI58031.1 ABC transporter substrate-binding protein [Brachyspira hyodysenteriae]
MRFFGNFTRIIIILIISIMLFSCSKNENTSETSSLVIYSPSSRDFIDPLIEDFKSKNPNIEVEVIIAGTGELIKRIETEKNDPLCDVLMAANINLVKNNQDLFENYTTTNENEILDSYKNVEGTMTRFMISPSVLIVNTNLVGNINIEGYSDLTNEKLKGKIAFNDPSTSSSSFKHLVTILYTMGKDDINKGWEYIDKLCDNLDGKLLTGSSAVYKGVADNEYTVGLTFENAAANYAASGSPVKLVYMKEGVIMEPAGIYIIKNAKNMENAKKFLDYMTSFDTQKKMNDELNARAVRKDLGASPILVDIKNINAITSNEELEYIDNFVKENQEAWLEKFKNIITDKL